MNFKEYDKIIKEYKFDMLFYNNILYNLIINLMKENEKHKEIIDRAKEVVADYKDQWAGTDDIVEDMQMLLNILEDKEV